MSESDYTAFLTSLEHGKYEIRDVCTIGRMPGCTIVVEGTKVSRKHAHIFPTGGVFQLVDNGSTNGTYHNGHRVQQPVTLSDGDTIMVGDHTFIFRLAAPGLSIPEGDMALEQTQAHIEQVPCWFLVADVKSSTSLAQNMGPEKWPDEIGRWFQHCRSILADWKGEVNKSTGDGFLAIWKERDELQEIAGLIKGAVLDFRKMIAESPLPFRFVVHYGKAAIGGKASLGEEALAGLDVHFVFRMEKLADQFGTDILLSTPAVQQIGEPSLFREVGSGRVKGFEQAEEFDKPFFTLA